MKQVLFICTGNIYRSKYAEAYFNLGNTLKSKGNIIDAKKYTEQACKINPNFAEAYSNLGCIHYSLGDKKQAKSCFIKAINLKPDYIDAHMNLGNYLYQSGEWLLALDEFLFIK